jgi:hypothetical protein
MDIFEKGSNETRKEDDDRKSRGVSLEHIWWPTKSKIFYSFPLIMPNTHSPTLHHTVPKYLARATAVKGFFRKKRRAKGKEMKVDFEEEN